MGRRAFGGKASCLPYAWMGLWSSHPARDAVSLTRREHGIGRASASAAGEAFRGEGILPSHAPQGAVLHMPVRRCARLSARGRAECPPSEGPDSEPNHRGINMLRNLLHGRERILPSPSMDGSSSLQREGTLPSQAPQGASTKRALMAPITPPPN